MTEKTVENLIKIQPRRALKLTRPGEIRVRVAPSPTGSMHLGIARTALFNFLFAKKYQGSLILRIEDTDLERSKKEWENDIFEGLEWLGIIPDESPKEGGKYGPYRQSERKEIYQKYLQKLLGDGKIYFCFCPKEDLESYRQYLMSLGKPPCYSGKCRNLSGEEVEKNLKEGRPFVLRFKTPQRKVVFDDMLRGKIEYDSSTFGDMVAAKDTSTPLYNLACVIDDFEMKITHIIRGEDHIPNTPKQILMAEGLDLPIPKFLHLPLILGPDRTKLSKRHQVFPVSEYKNQGYLAEAIVNFIALLGWNPGTTREIFSLSSLIKEFSLEKIQKAGAIFNITKLDWMNSFYIRSKSKQNLTEICLPFLKKAGLIEEKTEKSGLTTFKIKETGEEISFNWLENIIALSQERMKKLSEIGELSDFFFKEKLDFNKEMLKWKETDEKKTKTALEKSKDIISEIEEGDWTKTKLQEVLIAGAENFDSDKGHLLWPLRVALTGKIASPGPFEIAEVLGKEKTLKRIKQALKKF